MARTLFISDLDGTLLDADSKLSAESVSLLNEAIRKGALFSVATARTPSTVSVLLEKVDVNLPLIVMTGAALWNPANDRFLRPVTLSDSTSLELLDIFRKAELPVFVYRLIGNKIHIYHSGPLSPLEKNFIAERDESKYKIFHIDENGESLFPMPLTDVALFYTMQPSGHVERVYEEIKGKIDCNPVFYHDIFGEETGIMEVFSPLASKASALKWLKKEYDIERVVAFGDNINDIPMLREADLAVAVENAKPEVKEIADVIIGKNTSDSVARFILSNI